MKNYLILQVRELLDRNLDVIEIAHRLHVDVGTVTTVVELIKGVVT